MVANPPPGWLCHICAKSSGANLFRQPALPRKQKPAGDKPNVVSYNTKNGISRTLHLSVLMYVPLIYSCEQGV